MITALLAIVVVILIYVIMTWKPRLHHIPGPPGNPIYGHLGMLNMTSFHQQLEAWSKEHGPIIRLQLADRTRVATNDFDSIYKVTINQSIKQGSKEAINQSINKLTNQEQLN